MDREQLDTWCERIILGLVMAIVVLVVTADATPCAAGQRWPTLDDVVPTPISIRFELSS